jgi:hypothetical protein
MDTPSSLAVTAHLLSLESRIVMHRSPKPLGSAPSHARPAARAAELLYRRAAVAGDIYPADAGHGTIDGPDPDRILFLGDPRAITVGVRTHELSLPAFFARHLTARTRRGVTWSITALPNSRLEDAPEVVASRACDLQHVDAVVLLAGITDVFRATSARRWEQQLASTLDALSARVPRGTAMLVGEIPPLDTAGGLPRPARIAAGAHGRALNRRTRSVLAAYESWRAMPFPVEATNSFTLSRSEPRRYARTYKIWGEHLADALLEQPSWRL